MTEKAANTQKGQLIMLLIFVGVPSLLIGGFIGAYVWAKWFGVIGFALLLWAVGAIFVKTVEGREAKSLRNQSIERIEDEIGSVPHRHIDIQGRIFAKSPTAPEFLWASGSILHVIPFGEVAEAEVLLDSNSINKVNKGSLAAGMVGGFILLGGVGAVAGAVAAGRTERRQVSSITIRLVTTNSGDLHLPFYKGVALPDDNPAIRTAAREAEHWRAEFVRAMQIAAKR